MTDVEHVISSRDPATLPRVAAVVSLADLARGAGWHVRVGYAVVRLPERTYLNGNEARAAHELRTIVVAFRRPGTTIGQGRAMWEWCSDWPPTPTGRPPGWRFDYAFVGGQKMNLAQVRERITACPTTGPERVSSTR